MTINFRALAVFFLALFIDSSPLFESRTVSAQTLLETTANLRLQNWATGETRFLNFGNLRLRDRPPLLVARSGDLIYVLTRRLVFVFTSRGERIRSFPIDADQIRQLPCRSLFYASEHFLFYSRDGALYRSDTAGKSSKFIGSFDCAVVNAMNGLGVLIKGKKASFIEATQDGRIITRGVIALEASSMTFVDRFVYASYYKHSWMLLYRINPITREKFLVFSKPISEEPIATDSGFMFANYSNDPTAVPWQYLASSNRFLLWSRGDTVEVTGSSPNADQIFSAISNLKLRDHQAFDLVQVTNGVKVRSRLQEDRFADIFVIR